MDLASLPAGGLSSAEIVVALAQTERDLLLEQQARKKQEQELQSQNFYQKIYYHRLGTPQSEDTLVYDRPDQSVQHIDHNANQIVSTIRLGVEE